MNGGIYALRGDKINAVANFSAMVPVFGTGLKYGVKGIAKGAGTTYEIADGVRRAKAAQQLGHKTIEAVDNAG
ncbi:hypothetical protein BA768_18940 [Chryseobacterium sp. CBo1]|nr:hypothetical protein BA768_18940 [Chryseobacterium sp. CBo1]